MKERLDSMKGKTILVASAGNKGNNKSVTFPARHPAVISVGSLHFFFKYPIFLLETQVLTSITVENCWHLAVILSKN